MEKVFLFPSILMVSSIFFFPSAAFASSAKTKTLKFPPLQYTLQDVHGNVQIIPAGDSKPEQAQEEESLFAGDEILTKGGAKASLSLNSSTLVHLSENSDLKVSQLAARKKAGSFLSRLDLLTGTVLAEVEKLRESRSLFEVTSGGVVCGVRGTAFEVQKEGSSVQTNTYHGTVEMQKNGKTRRVTDNQQGSFAFDKDTFLPTRALTPEERARYQNWLTQKAVVERKLLERRAVLDSMANLNAEERAEVLEKLDKVKERDRLKVLRQLLQGQYDRERKRMQEDAVRNREEILRKIQEDSAKKRAENDQPRK
ncbi:MAG TPA: FecR domain-containing protein [bacterium]|nr:FecR domain-containing protein [bacterium]